MFSIHGSPPSRSSLGGPLKKSVAQGTAPKASGELKQTVTNRASAGLSKKLLKETTKKIAKALLAILTRSLPPALTATLTAALRPLRELRAGVGVAGHALGTAAIEACSRCVAASQSDAPSALQASCRYCALSRESQAELVAMTSEEGDMASHHFGSYYAGFYAKKVGKAMK